MLVFATTSTAFLACKAVLPIITGTQVEHETGSQAGDSAEGPGAWLYIASSEHMFPLQPRTGLGCATDTDKFAIVASGLTACHYVF
jgi:hypothetical protein